MPTKRRVLWIALFLAALLALGTVNAWGWGNLTLKIENKLVESVAQSAGVGTVGDELYDLQEGAHQVITDTTGYSIPHSYVWLCAGSECIPVDPFEFSR